MSNKHIKEIVDGLLANESWFGDGLVSYKYMGTAQEAAEASRSTSKFLRKWGKQRSELLLISQKLDSCSLQARCNCLACPQCGRAYQRAFVKLAKAALPEAETAVFTPKLVSLVKQEWKVLPKQLDAACFRRVSYDMQATVDQLGFDAFVGGWDISANYDVKNRSKWYFQLQVAGIALSHDWKAVKDNCHLLLRPTSSVLRPSKFQNWNRKNRALAYCVKPKFFGREQYVAKNKRHPDRGPCLNTRSRNLRVPERREILAMLDGLGFQSRHIFLGARFVQVNGVPRIALNMSRRPAAIASD